MLDLTPDQMSALLSSSVYDDQDRDIREQLAQLAALRGEIGRPHTTGAGAFYGGIGDVVKNLVAGHQQGKLREEQRRMQDSYTQALRAAFQPRAAAPAAEAPVVNDYD